jgi:siroheme synthase-like protein
MMLDLTDHTIVIVGGGAVAARKAAGVAAAGGQRIRVVAPEFRGDFAPELDRRCKLYEASDLKDADLVFAATDSTIVNDAVVRDARAAGILVNRADTSDELPGDFVTPAKFQAGSITVTVSAQSAALAAAIRDELEANFDADWVAMADAMQTLRPMIKSSGRTPAQRSALFRALATPQARQLLQQSGLDGLKNWIMNLPGTNL